MLQKMTSRPLICYGKTRPGVESNATYCLAFFIFPNLLKFLMHAPVKGGRRRGMTFLVNKSGISPHFYYFPTRMRLLLLFSAAHFILGRSYYDPEKCGIPRREKRSADEEWGKVEPELKVMGGVDASPGELPWVVYFHVPRVIQFKRKGPHSICGGTMISSRHLLTSAHCFQLGYKEKGCEMEDMMTPVEIAREVVFVVGASCRSNKRDNDCPPHRQGVARQAVRVAFIKQFFEEGCPLDSHFDVALIELTEDVDYPHVCLPHLHEIDRFLNESVFTFGWGEQAASKHFSAGRHVSVSKQETRPLNNKLQFLDLHFYHPPEKCRKEHDLPYDSLVCTPETGQKSMCRGDSGGGILLRHERRYYLLGIISHGSACKQEATGKTTVRRGQVSMDVNLYTATIDKYFGRQAPNYREQWKDWRRMRRTSE